MNFRYPIFLDLTGKKCLVTGEGYEIASKVQGLLDAGGHVTYINPSAEPAIQALAAKGAVRWEPRAFEARDLDGFFIVITDHADNSEIFRLAEEQRVLCNAVDDPAHCHFSFGSVHRQQDLTIAISTNGWAPAMAVRLKERLEREIGPEYGELLRLLKEVRPEIGARIPDFASRRELWYRIVDSDVLTKLQAGQKEEAEQMIRFMMEEAAREAPVSNISRSDTSGGGEHR